MPAAPPWPMPPPGTPRQASSFPLLASHIHRSGLTSHHIERGVLDSLWEERSAMPRK